MNSAHLSVTMRNIGLFATLLLAFSTQPCLAENADDSLLVYAVNIHQTPMQSWGPGYGIYLGKGLFITAAHVAGRSWLTRPKVAIAGHEYPTSVVKEGSFEGTDLALLAVDEDLLPLRLRRIRRRPQVSARNHEPEDFAIAETTRQHQNRNPRYRQIFRAGLDNPRIHPGRDDLLTGWTGMTFLRIVIPLRLLFEHDLFGKPVSTFPDHAQ